MREAPACAGAFFSPGVRTEAQGTPPKGSSTGLH